MIRRNCFIKVQKNEFHFNNFMVLLNGLFIVIERRSISIHSRAAVRKQNNYFATFLSLFFAFETIFLQFYCCISATNHSARILNKYWTLSMCDEKRLNAKIQTERIYNLAKKVQHASVWCHANYQFTSFN